MPENAARLTGGGALCMTGAERDPSQGPYCRSLQEGCEACVLGLTNVGRACQWIVDKVEFKEADEIIVANGNNLQVSWAMLPQGHTFGSEFHSVLCCCSSSAVVLQERKRLLWETCDCIIVLPGGTGGVLFAAWW